MAPAKLEKSSWLLGIEHLTSNVSEGKLVANEKQILMQAFYMHALSSNALFEIRCPGAAWQDLRTSVGDR